jgi:hypothetical protein
VKYKLLHLLKTVFSFNHLILLLSFISLPVLGQSSKILKMIPGNASMIFTINGNSINKKIDFNKIKNHAAFRLMDSLAHLQLKENYNIVSGLLKNPSHFGIDLKSNIYSFYRKSDNSANYFGGIFIPLCDKDKFETFLLQTGGPSIKDKIIRKGRYSYITEEGFLFAWTKQYCMIVSKPFLYKGANKDLSTQLINKIIKQKTKHSILNNENFLLSQKTNFDFAYWISYQSFFNQSMIRTFRTENIAEDNKDFFTGNYVHSYVNILNGNITCDSKFFINDKISNKVKSTFEKKANPDLLKYLHKDTLLALICFSIDLREAQITVNENMRKSKEKFKTEILKRLFQEEFQKDDTLIAKNKELNDLYFKYHSTDTIPFTYTPPQIEIETVPISDSINPEGNKNSTVTYSYSYLDYDFLEDLIKNKNNEIKIRENELTNNKIKSLGYTENDLWDLFEGDIVIGLTDFKYKETKYMAYESEEHNDDLSKQVEKIKKEVFPEFIIAATTYKTETVKRVLVSLENQGLIKNHGHYYTVVSDSSDYAIFLSDKILIVTNDEALIRNNIKVYPEKEMVSQNVRELLLSNSFSMYLNPERILSKMPRDTTYKLYDNLFPKSIKNLTAKGDFLSQKPISSELILTMANKANNTLYEIFRLINQAYILSIKR